MTNYFPECELEDSPNCYWDASSAGNGVGHSFIDVDGFVFYADDVYPGPTGEDTIWVFPADTSLSEITDSLPETVICGMDLDGDSYLCSITLDPSTITDTTDTADSYVATPPTPTETTTETESTTVTVTPPPSTLAETGNDFDPFIGLGIGAILIFVGASAYMIDRIKKVRR